MVIVFPLIALIGVLILTLRSLGLGLLAVFAVGYVNGVIRANYMSVFTTFMFDCALLGLYVGFLTGWARESARAFHSKAGKWVFILILWPALLVLIPVNDYLIQLVAFRASVWFLPVLLVASRLRSNDLSVLARGLVFLNLIALAGGIYIYVYGVESLYPQNDITQIIYKSNDVAGRQYHRIPSTFLNAHSYGGAMLFSLPFLLDRLFGRGVRFWDRAFASLGVAAAIGGMLLCAARMPVVVFGLMMIISWCVSRFNPSIGLLAAGLAAIGVAIAGTDERLQRATTLEDTERVSERVQSSANESFLELFVEYPVGAGMGSAFGTSIPYFLADRAPVPIGLENELSRIQVDQGIVGLGLWVAFVIWLLHRPPPLRLDVPWGLGVMFMYSLVVVTWSTSFIGAGALSAIPGSVLLLTQMGILVRVREVTDGTQT